MSSVRTAVITKAGRSSGPMRTATASCAPASAGSGPGDIAAEWITREGAIKLEPGLAIPRSVGDVAFFADDAWLDASCSICMLIDAAVANGADVHERTPVHSVHTRGGTIDALIVDQGAIAADSVLTCVGPATKTFLETLGVEMPVDRVPGLLAVTSRPAEALERVIHAPGLHLRPDASGGLLLGSEDVDAPAANTTSAAEHAKLAEMLRGRAAGVFPAARDTSILEYRIGVRPMPADRHTIAGRIPDLANAWMIATHSGVTLGALLGRLIADEIVRGIESPMLAPFRPDRFRAASPTLRLSDGRLLRQTRRPSPGTWTASGTPTAIGSCRA